MANINHPRYCGTFCQKSHFPIHKTDCKKAAIKYEELHADYVLLEPPPDNLDLYCSGNYKQTCNPPVINLADYNNELFKVLWATKPPRDILRLAKYEGMDYQKSLELCFTSARDLGSVMTTINTLPSSYGSQCTVSMNEANAYCTMRNILILGLALVGGFTNGRTVETITHLWYSAFLTEEMYDQVMSLGREIAKAFGDPDAIANDDYTTVAFGIPRAKSKLYMTLKKEYVLLLHLWFDRERPMDGFDKTRKLQMGEDYNPLLNKFKDMWLAQIPPAYRVLDKQYRETGLLLPYGANTNKFCKPNLTFGNNDAFHCGHLARPTDSADLPKLVEFAKKHKLPKNDVNGALYHATIAMVAAFCKKVVTHKVLFRVSSFPIAELPARLLNNPEVDWGFDRIDIAVESFVSPPYGEFLAEFIELLKSNTENPHAKMSLLVSTEPDGALIAGETSARRNAQDLLPWRKDCLKALAGGLTTTNLMFARFEAVAEMMAEAHQNWKAKLRRYGWTDKQGPLGQALITSPLSDEDEWPYQLRAMDFTEEEFVLRMCGSVKGNERLIMWQHSA